MANRFSQVIFLIQQASCYRYQRWSRGHNLRGQARVSKKKKKKIGGQGQSQGPTFRGQIFSRPRTGIVEIKHQGHNFSKSWSANFLLFLSANVFKIFDRLRAICPRGSLGKTHQNGEYLKTCNAKKLDLNYQSLQVRFLREYNFFALHVF